MTGPDLATRQLGGTVDVAELRRLATAAREEATFGWSFTTEERGDADWTRYITAASPDVVLALLDRLAHMREARDNARAEVGRLAALVEAAKIRAAECDALAAKVAECEALMVELQPDPVLVGDSWIPFRDLAEVCGNFMRSSTEHAREAKALAAKVERVRALHYAADNDVTRTPACETCHGRAGVHECGCWASEDRQPVCGHCNEGDKGISVAWPCPTIRAIGAES